MPLRIKGLVNVHGGKGVITADPAPIHRVMNPFLYPAISTEFYQEDDMNPKLPDPPKGLQSSGKALWRAVLAEYECNPAELRLLREAARTTDELDRLAEAMPDADLTVAGSRGQPRPSPLLDEARKHRDTLVRLLTALKEDKK